MELWEKEYLETIEREKDKQNKKNSYGKNRGKGNSNPQETLGIIILVLFLLVNLPRLFERVDLSNISSALPAEIRSSLTSVFGGTFVNGIGFHNMMISLTEGEETCGEFLSTSRRLSFSLTREEIESWRKQITDLEKNLEELRYDSSYKEVVSSYRECVAMCGSLLKSIEQGDSFEVVAGIYNGALGQQNAMHSALIRSFDLNGIDYRYGADGRLYYSYKMR